MPNFEPGCAASLIDSIYRPRRSTLAACLERWTTLDRSARANCYLVVEGDAGARLTLTGTQIAQLAAGSSRLAC